MKALIQTLFTTPISYTSHYYPCSSSLPPLINIPQQTQQKTFRIFSKPKHQQTQTNFTTKLHAGWVPISEYVKETLGMSEAEALKVSKSVIRSRYGKSDIASLIFREDADNVVTLFKQYCGLDNSVIKEIVRRFPTVLAANAAQTLQPKVKILKDVGFDNTDLAEALSNPLAFLKADKKAVVTFLREFLGCRSGRDIVTVCKAFTVGKNEDLVKNVTMLVSEFGVDKEIVKKFLVKYPSKFMVKNEEMRGLVVWVEEIFGVKQDCDEFMPLICMLGAQTERKRICRVQTFLDFGWTMSDIVLLFTSEVDLFQYNELRQRSILRFYMKELRYEPAYLASRSELFAVSLEIVEERNKILSNLRKRGLIEDDYELASAFLLTEEEFFNEFVDPYVNVLDVCEEYINNRGSDEAVPLTGTSEGGSD